MISKPHLIAVADATSEQIEAVHALVKEHAKGWWHHYGAVWIVGGDYDVIAWRKVLQPTLKAGDASILVVALPETAERRVWSYYGTSGKKRTEWLKTQYSGRPDE